MDLSGWTFELKYDGYRGILYYEQGACRLMSKKNRRLAFPMLERSLANVIKKKARTLILDGEVCSFDDTGKPVFENLQRRKGIIAYMGFDVLFHNGKDLRDTPLWQRRELLLWLIGTPQTPPILRATQITDSVDQFFKRVVEEDLEGLVAKHKDGLYRPPSTRWYKLLNPSYSQTVYKRKVFRR